MTLAAVAVGSFALGVALALLTRRRRVHVEFEVDDRRPPP